MKTFIIFLRGINVNGINIKMNQLKTLLESLGYENVITVLATGNVIIQTREEINSESEHKKFIEKSLQDAFHYEASIIIKSELQLKELMNEAEEIQVSKEYHHYVLLTDDFSLGNNLKTLFQIGNRLEGEQFILGKEAFYWIVEKQSTLLSDFGKKVLGKKEYKTLLTSRNLNTIQKIIKYL